MKKCLLLLVVCSWIMSCAKMKVQGLADNNYESKSGLIYKLPKTCIVFTIQVKSTTYTPSECFKKNVDKIPLTVNPSIVSKLKNSGEFSVRKITAVEVTTMPVDDPDKYFLIETNKKAFQDRTYGVALNNQGFMTNGSIEVKDNTFDVATQFVSSAASFISPLAMKRAPNGPDDDFCGSQVSTYNALQRDRDDFFQLKRQPIGVAFPTADLYQKVLDEYEKAEVSLFDNAFFTTEIEKTSCTIFFTPNKTNDLLTTIKEKAFFRYDPDKNIIYVNKDLPGKISLQNSSGTEIQLVAEGSITVDSKLRRLTILPQDNETTVDNRLVQLNNENAQGLRYNIPRQCVLSLNKHGNLPSVAGTIQLPQWGIVGRLNEKMSKITVVLNPETGALLSANLESKGITAEQIKNAMTAASSVRDLFMRDKDAEALAKMEKKIKFLETQEKLNQLQQGEATELIELRKESELLAEKKKVAELRKALKELEQE